MNQTHWWTRRFLSGVGLVIAIVTSVIAGTLGTVSAADPPSGPFAYVTNMNSNSVSVIDTSTNTVTATINGVAGPAFTALTPDRSRLYVTNWSNGGGSTVTVINTSNNSVISTIPVGRGAYAVSVNPAGTRAYVTSTYGWLPYSPGTVAVIDISTSLVIATIPVGVGPMTPAVTPDGRWVYVPNWSSNMVSVIDTSTNTVVRTINTASTPFNAALNPSGTRLYVTHYYNATVSVIDIASNTVIGGIAVAGGGDGIAINPAGTRAYVSHVYPWDGQGDVVSVIDLTSNTRIATVPVGHYPYGVSVNPSGTRVYVANQLSNTVSVIDTATNTVVGTIPVGAYPVAISQFIAPAKADTTTSVASSQNPSTYGQAVTFTATVTSSAGTPNGTVQFKRDGSNYGLPVALSSGSATNAAISTLSAGNHTVSVTYSGDANNNGSTSPNFTQTVNKAPATVTLGNLNQTYDGTPKPATASIVPPNLMSIQHWIPEAGVARSNTTSTSSIRVGTRVRTYFRDGPAFVFAESADGRDLTSTTPTNVRSTGVSGSPDATTSNPAVIQRADGKFLMVYESHTELSPPFSARRLLARISDDGANFGTAMALPSSALDLTSGDNKVFQSVPDLIQLPDGSLRLYYVAGGVNIASMRSIDGGQSWTQDAGFRLQRQSPRVANLDPDVIPQADGSFLMYIAYSEIWPSGIGYQSIRLARSTDGLNFTLEPDNLLAPYSGVIGLVDPDVFQASDGRWYMYYGEVTSASLVQLRFAIRADVVTFTYNGSAAPPTNAGTYTVVGTVQDVNYQGSASGTLVIARANQTINFGALVDKTYGDADFTVGATASSGLAVTFTTSGACTVSGNTVHITGLGSATITAHQGGDGNYNAAPGVSQTFTVNITYDRLGELVRQFVSKQGIVNSLLAKLDNAKKADARGDANAKAGMIGTFINEVEAQTGKAISPENAAILIALAKAL